MVELWLSSPPSNSDLNKDGIPSSSEEISASNSTGGMDEFEERRLKAYSERWSAKNYGRFEESLNLLDPQNPMEK